MDAPSTQRFLSLDAFRGLTIAAMIMVNLPSYGGVSRYFHHAAWDQCLPADLIFPFFLFIVGAAIYFSTRKVAHQLSWSLSGKILKRGAMLFVLGILLHSVPFDEPLSNWRILGVLQRIGVVYCCASFLALWLQKPWRIVFAIVVILLGYWALLVGVDGLKQGDFSTHLFCKVDTWLIGRSHMLAALEPESLLSSIPAIGNALFGYLAAMLMCRSSVKRGALCLGLLGIAGVGLALLWSEFLPLNKTLWSSSFVLYTSAWAACVWAVMVWCVEVRGWKSGLMPLLVLGANAIFAYSLSVLLSHANVWDVGAYSSVGGFLHAELFALCGGANVQHLMWAACVLGVCWVASYLLYRKKIFIRL